MAILGGFSFPKNIGEWWESSLETFEKAPMAVGGVFSGAKQLLGLGAAAIGGGVIASLFGGGKQEQEQDSVITQEPIIEPILETKTNPILESFLEMKQLLAQRQETYAETSIEESFIGEGTNIASPVTETINISQTYNMPRQETTTYTSQDVTTITYAAPEQSQEATQKTDMSMLLLLAVGGVAAYFLLKDK